MACGLPCIALRPDGRTIRTANTEIIENDESGLLVEPDPRAVADAIQRLSADPALRRRLGDQACRRARGRFTWPLAGRALHDLLLSFQPAHRAADAMDIAHATMSTGRAPRRRTARPAASG
jgi:glycosyltransferase involved in cell wall biosynthesis